MNNDPWKHRSTGIDGEKASKLGRCRRHAPTMSVYPVVFRDDWCGDHKLDENTL